MTTEQLLNLYREGLTDGSLDHTSETSLRYLSELEDRQRQESGRCGPGTEGTDRCGCGGRTDRNQHGTETCRRTGQSFTYSHELGRYCYHRSGR